MKAFFLGCFVVVAALLAILHYTGRGADHHGVVELVWATDDNPTRQEQMALFREWYRRTYGEPIDIRIDPSNYSQAKVVVQSVAGSGPDLFDYFGSAALQSYVESGIMLDVSGEAGPLGFQADLFWPVLKNSLCIHGRQYAAPDNAVSNLILIRRDLLKEKGLSLPQAGWTWADLVRLAQALTERDAAGRVTRFGLLGIGWMNLVVQNGGEFFNGSGTRCLLNRPETVEALRFYSDLKTKYHVMPSAAEAASLSSAGGYGSGGLNLFASGQGAMIEYGRYGYIVLNRINAERKAAGEPLLDVVPLPPLGEKRATGIASARCTGINRRSPHRREALRFLAFLASPEFNAQTNRSADSLNTVPGDAGDLGGGRAAIPGCDDPLWVASVQEGVPYPASPFVNGTAVTAILKEEIDRQDSGLQGPEQTAARMESRVNAAIADHLKLRPRLREEWQALEGRS